MEGPKKEKKKKKMLFEFYPICCGHGNCLLWLASPVWGCVPSCSSGNQEEKRPADYPLTGFQKIGCLQREARQFKKCLMGFQIEQNVRVPLQLLPRSRSTATCPCPHTEMRWKSTYREKWPVKLQSGRFAPSVQAQRFPSRMAYVEAKVEGYSGIKRHSPPLTLSLISSPLPLSSFSQLIFCFHNAPTGCCASVCVLLSFWRQKT